MPAQPSSAGKRSRASDFQGVGAYWPLVSAQKGSNNECKLPEDINIQGSTRSGEEGE